MIETPIFVINLEKSENRKIFMDKQLSKLSNNVVFFPAINGKDNPNFYLFKKYNEKKRFYRKGNLMNLSQLGCFASHYLLWEKCIELNRGIIILEDDAIIRQNFSEIYQFTSSKENIFEFFWLSPPAPVRRYQKGKEIYTIPNTNNKISLYFKGWANATGYFITPKAAQKLLDYCEEWIYDLDISMDRYWENKLHFLAITPACVEPDFSLESNIPVYKKSNKTTLVKIRKEYFNLIDKIKSKYFNILALIKK